MHQDTVMPPYSFSASYSCNSTVGKKTEMLYIEKDVILPLWNKMGLLILARVKQQLGLPNKIKQNRTNQSRGLDRKRISSLEAGIFKAKEIMLSFPATTSLKRQSRSYMPIWPT